MFHPTAKSRLIFVRRLFLHALIEFFLKVLSALLAAGIDDVTIPLCNHLCLSMTGITLYSLDVAASPDQLIADGMDIEDGVREEDKKDIPVSSVAQGKVHYIDVIAIIQDLNV